MIKVYLVEDEPLVRRGIISIMPFERYGMQLVGEASSAEEAMAALAQTDVDLVFTDISMPGMSGLDFIRELKLRKPNIRAVVLTCHQDFDYLQQALRLGAIDYMVKTLFDEESVEALLGRVSAHIRQAAQAGGQAQDAETVKDKEELSKKWSGLSWLIVEDEYETLLHRSRTQLRLTDWRDLLIDAHRQWRLLLPALQKLSDLEQALAAAGSPGELGEAVSAYRREARRLLRDTMYSEEVVASVVRALEMVGQLEGDKLSQADICKAINMSISYFSKCFKEIVGVPFVLYMQDRNIRMAQHLLQTTNYPIYLIAERSGFQDEKYFGKIFRLKTGLSPSEHRLRSRGN
ncbi:response regulator transcription factor [Cohnella sp. 56]|uniref:response regulator transcription factor n=1 Tax=Cohnella sp. 56 TaxID=3113722 RepID=UPI0030E7C136